MHFKHTVPVFVSASHCLFLSTCWLDATLACLWHQHLPAWKMPPRFVWLTSAYAARRRGRVYSVCSCLFLSFFSWSLCLSVLEIRGGACRVAAAERGRPWWSAGGWRRRRRRWKDASRCELTGKCDVKPPPARQEFLCCTQKLTRREELKQQQSWATATFYEV